MDDMKGYVNAFFKLLNIESDNKQGHFFKEYIQAAVMEFLDDEIKKEAYDVYSLFLDIYRVNISGEKSFIDLLDVLREYEENAAVLNDKQRDHYIHSLNVFLLGLAIYAQNAPFRKCFEEHIANTNRSLRYFDTTHEEFFFRWGVASLFHDIGYPVEIISNQLDKFIAFVSGGDAKGKAIAKPYLSYFDFETINWIEALQPEKFVLSPYAQNAIAQKTVLQDKPTDLIALGVSDAFDLPIGDVKENLNSFLETMQKYQFVDHGFYSAIIVLKWFGELMQKKSKADMLLYSHVIDAAMAIYMHNAYRNVYQKAPYSLPKMRAETHPISYLLILCDEAQEWNRKAYGIKTRSMVNIDDSNILISDRELKLHYITKSGVIGEKFIVGKTELINKLLDIGGLFNTGLTVTATTLTEQYLTSLVEKRDKLVPRILIEQIEQIAKGIHENYNQKRLKDYPGIPLEYPTWSSLPDTLKYSNIRQAKDMVSKLKAVGYYIAEYTDDEPVRDLSADQVEFLAKIEHDSWVEERKNTGWTFGMQKDVEKKVSPYMIPYEELPEEIKDYDREAVRAIIPLLNAAGIHVYRDADLQALSH